MEVSIWTISTEVDRVSENETTIGKDSVRETTYPLENGDREGGSLTGSGLGLGDNVVSLDDGDDGSLLNGRRSLETVGVDSSKKLGLKLHVVEA